MSSNDGGPSYHSGFDPSAVVDQSEQQFGRYFLKYKLSQGGMGTVYLGTLEDGSGFSRPVAIKRIHDHMASSRALVEMFLDEANIASRIDHPNVCRLFDFGQVDGVLYIAMEYLAGMQMVRLSRAVSKKADLLHSPRWHGIAAKITADAALGLHAAHELTDETGENLGTVHRDVSPQNIFLTFEGAVKLLDFGIVFARQRFHETKNLSLKGKISYMAPEQLLRVEVDRRTDIWSLGVCLWEMLAGRRLNSEHASSKSIDTLLDVHRSIPRPSEIYLDIPHELDQIVTRALSWDREKRHATALELSEELAAFVMSSEQPSRPHDVATLLKELFTVEHRQETDIVKTVLGADETVVIVREKRPKSSDGATAPESDELARPIPATVPGVNLLAHEKGEQEHHGKSLAKTLRLPLHGSGAEATEPWGSSPPVYDNSIDSERTIPRIVSPSESETDNKNTSMWSRFFLFFPLALAVSALVFLLTILLSGELTPNHESTDPSGSKSLLGIDPALIASPRGKPRDDEEDIAVQTRNGEGDVELGLPSPAPTSSDVAEGESGAAPDQGDVGSPDDNPHDAAAAPQRNGKRTRTRTKTNRTAAYGQVNVVAVGGWATVSERGRSLGMTPTRLRLQEGRHVLTVRPFGQPPPKQVVVNIEANKTVRVVVPVGP